MKNTHHLKYLIKSQAFRFERLLLEDVDNSPVFDFHSHEIANQEICFFTETYQTAINTFTLYMISLGRVWL